MIQAAGINIKSAGSPVRGKLDRKFYVGLLAVVLVLAAFFYWRYLNHLTQVRGPAVASRTVPSAASPAPAAGKPELAAIAPPADPKASPANTNNSISVKAATTSFADSLMSVLVPSAKATTIQPEMLPAPTAHQPVTVPASRLPLVTQASARPAPQPLTAEQKRLQTAQSGFDDVMDLAHRYPDPYGFKPADSLREARLGNPIPVYTITQPDRKNYTAGQPVKPLLKPPNEWVYPIILGDRIRFMVQVKQVENEYVVGKCSRALAMVYDQILRRWPASEGFHPQLVVNAKMPGYYFTIPELPDQNLTDTSQMFQTNPRLSPAAVILASWQ
jgi:hypothetical protein